MNNEQLAKQAAEKLDTATVRGSNKFTLVSAPIISSTYAPVFETIRELRDALETHIYEATWNTTDIAAIASANTHLEPTDETNRKV